MSRFFDPYTDFGFKKLFAEEANKDLLIDFLNTLLPPRDQVVTLTFQNSDMLGMTPGERRAVFDIYCKNSKDEPFIIEMQRAEQEYFVDRSLYYTTHPIREQAIKGGSWNFRQKTVYFIGILNFKIFEEDEEEDMILEVELKDQKNRRFYEKLKFYYIQMPLFEKTEAQLETRRDKWLYFLKNLSGLDDIPAIFKEPVFEKAFHTAELASMSKEDIADYEQSLNDYRTYMATIETAENIGIEIGVEQGIEIGKEQGIEIGAENTKLDIARKMKYQGFECDTISQLTGLSVKEIQRLD